MSVELLTPLAEPEPWELEEPRRRRFSPIELDAAADANLRPSPEGWDTEQYYRLAEMGVLGPEERLELLDGEILEMSPQRNYHAEGVMRALRVLTALFEPAHHVRPQLPFHCGPRDEPEPDLAVIEGPYESSEGQHPTGALLIVEISDTTLRYDLGKKASLYASVGVPGYWVIDLKTLRVIVHRDPQPAESTQYGWAYGSATAYSMGEKVIPMAAADRAVEVRDLIPQELREKKQ